MLNFELISCLKKFKIEIIMLFDDDAFTDYFLKNAANSIGKNSATISQMS